MKEQFELKAAGEKVVIIRSAYENDGNYVEFLVSLAENGDGPPLHIHLHQTEIFEAVKGQLGIIADDNTVILNPGESYEVLPGIPHSFFSPDKAEIEFKVGFKPALNMQWFGREMISACNRNKAKYPKLLEGAYILWKMRKEYQLHNEPGWNKIARPVLFCFALLFKAHKAINMDGYSKVK